MVRQRMLGTVLHAPKMLKYLGANTRVASNFKDQTLVQPFVVFTLVSNHLAVIIKHLHEPLLFPRGESAVCFKPCFLALEPIHIVCKNLGFGLSQFPFSDPIIDPGLLMG
jgi:hypothetical protein